MLAAAGVLRNDAPPGFNDVKSLMSFMPDARARYASAAAQKESNMSGNQAELRDQTRQLLDGPLKHIRGAALAAVLLPLASVAATPASAQAPVRIGRRVRDGLQRHE